MMHSVSLTRLYLMRVLYSLNFVLLGLDVWPSIVNHPTPWDPVKGAAFSLWASLSLLSAIGIRYPLQMLPLLLFQFTYKAIWLALIALPQWPTFKSIEMTQAMLMGIVLDVIAIPWPYVFASYIAKRGDRWRRNP